MAKRKSNRAARQTLDMDCWLSNRRAAVLFSFGYSPVKTKPSRSQRRAKRLVEEMRIERHYWQNVDFGMSAEQAWNLAVKTVKG
ncbi:hypothetical protein ACOMDM_13675 [Serratia plymuthica]|uniref:hypothetical protein n=1 Tax=Serratia plymuthica TaxID=82996 RepID=UPI003BA24755